MDTRATPPITATAAAAPAIGRTSPTPVYGEPPLLELEPRLEVVVEAFVVLVFVPDVLEPDVLEAEVLEAEVLEP